MSEKLQVTATAGPWGFEKADPNSGFVTSYSLWRRRQPFYLTANREIELHNDPISTEPYHTYRLTHDESENVYMEAHVPQDAWVDVLLETADAYIFMKPYSSLVLPAVGMRLTWQPEE